MLTLIKVNGNGWSGGLGCGLDGEDDGGGVAAAATDDFGASLKT